MQIAIGLGMMEGMQRFVPVEELFKGRHFDQEIVVLNVRWYVSMANCQNYWARYLAVAQSLRLTSCYMVLNTRL